MPFCFDDKPPTVLVIRGKNIMWVTNHPHEERVCDMDDLIVLDERGTPQGVRMPNVEPWNEADAQAFGSGRSA